MIMIRASINHVGFGVGAGGGVGGVILILYLSLKLKLDTSVNIKPVNTIIESTNDRLDTSLKLYGVRTDSE
jgi:hypothetical protein